MSEADGRCAEWVKPKDAFDVMRCSRRAVSPDGKCRQHSASSSAEREHKADQERKKMAAVERRRQLDHWLREATNRELLAELLRREDERWHQEHGT